MPLIPRRYFDEEGEHYEDVEVTEDEHFAWLYAMVSKCTSFLKNEHCNLTQIRDVAEKLVETANSIISKRESKEGNE